MRGNGKLFISHAHTDNVRCAPLLAALDAWGVDYWFDAQQLTPGDNLSADIQRAIRARDVFIRICTPAAQASYWVQLETGAFRGLQAEERRGGRGDRVLINLILDAGYEREPFDYASLFIDGGSRAPDEWLPELRRALRLPETASGEPREAPAPAKSAAPMTPVTPITASEPVAPSRPISAGPAPRPPRPARPARERGTIWRPVISGMRGRRAVVLALLASVVALVSLSGIALSAASGRLPFLAPAGTASPRVQRGGTPTATLAPTIVPTATPRPPAGFAWYTDQEQTYRVIYPSGWASPDEHTDSGLGAPNHITNFDPTIPSTVTAPGFQINASEWGVSNTSDDEIVRLFTPDNQPPPPGPAITVGGVSCAHREIQDIGPAHQRFDYLICHHGAKYVYVIVLNSLTAEFDHDYATIFKPMLDAFIFLGTN